MRNKRRDVGGPERTLSIGHSPLSPTFKINSELARWVHRSHVKNKRVTMAAFLPKPLEAYLSVNSVEMENYDEIAKWYANALSDDKEIIYMATRNISEYNSSAKKSGLEIQYINGRWKFNDKNRIISDAYKHRPNASSTSHCGVEYINCTTPLLIQEKIARRLSGARPRSEERRVGKECRL